MKKRNAVIVIVGLAFLLLGVGALFLYCYIRNITLVEYLTSKWAMLFYVFAGFDIVLVGGILLKDYVKRL